eukprot:TRINITY_DN5362_c0_g1_i1.p1 TRINITY_DN5362_c0_g1~~TRINITY_DN5362_c0_g1_i1.p1  ORF type:complete len:176 (-),score=21.54 TRINITY_DN5362_c0_g1_i1:160-687(-)
MKTPHQYLLLSAPPEKENKFRKLKVKHGSTFAFHGSSIENWHSILRRGLLNASGTNLQVNGKAHGDGIYLSPRAETSFGYCKFRSDPQPVTQKSNDTSNGNRFLSSSNVLCIALCEVVKKDLRKNGDIWVQPVEDSVVTRFFFVYSGSIVYDAHGCYTESPEFIQEVERAMNVHL